MVNKIYLLRPDMVANFIHISERKIILMEVTLKLQLADLNTCMNVRNKNIFQKIINDKTNYFTCSL